MSTLVISVVASVLGGIFAVVVLQAEPTRYRWSTTVSWIEDEQSGRAIHQVQFSRRQRRLWPGPLTRVMNDVRLALRKRRLWPRRRNPMDVTFHARVAVTGIGLRPKSEKIVPIPVEKEWRPVVAGGGVLTALFPEHCDPRELRYFPQDIKNKRAAGTLNLQDLLGVSDAELRMYAFAYRPHVGTRLMVRQAYRLSDIVPGEYVHGEVERSSDGKPPRRPEMLPPARYTAAPTVEQVGSLTAGPWILQVSRRAR
jgi:hypothetical protein